MRAKAIWTSVFFRSGHHNTELQILDRISLQYAPNANGRKTNERYEKRTIQETNELYGKRKRTNHWSVTIYYPMTNDPGSIEVQYSIVLLFE